MKHIKTLILSLALVFISLVLASCSEPSGDDGKIKVLLTYGSGVTVTSDNPVYINEGESASFDIVLDSTYVFSSVSHGEYSDGKLTVSGLTRDTSVKLYAENLGYDTTENYDFFFFGSDMDTSSVSHGESVKGGTEIRLTAGENFKIFLGWSQGERTADKVKMISTERDFTFRVSPSVANEAKVIRIYSNYADAGSYYYDPNGGVINLSTPNTAKSAYHNTQKQSSRLKVNMSGDYMELFGTVPLFYDDNTFTKEGYVLCEYNTKPDGSGVGYSLGSRYLIDVSSGELPVLYCIWKKAEREFEYVDFSYPLPDGINKNRAPDWKSEGVMITSYLGDADSVAIPEKIDGKYVTGIAKGAFKDKKMTELVLSKYIQRIEDGAFVGCDKLATVYFPDDIYDLSDAIFDAKTYTSFKKLYVNAVTAPRYANTDSGAMSVKLSRLLSTQSKKRIIVIAGSSTYQGLSSAYMEALLSDEYAVINFGTTRTTTGSIYLEAMGELAKEGDVILYAPENSTYMMGETELYWKTLRDLESMYNFYRHIDISNYSRVFTAFAEFNQGYRYKTNIARYEDGYACITRKGRTINEYGEYQKADRTGLSDEYIDAYFITLNNRYKSKYEGQWDNVEDQLKNNDYNDPENKTWESIDSERLSSEMNRVIAKAKSSGARVYFSFCPVDRDKLVEGASSPEWLAAYDKLIKDTYCFDGVIGSSADYIFNHEYFYDNAFHLNDVGRSIRTYQLYKDLSSALGIKNVKGYLSVGTEFEGCIFVDGQD